MSDADGWKVVRLDGTTLVDGAGDAVSVDDEARVRLWHPIAAAPAEVQHWRSLLADLELRQPFKAWREVYLLTPAEEQTETYSNRFAAHILGYPKPSR